ncbi:MAG: hypothetical protein U1E53_14540 [Dongiaceae bacterium]
MPPGPAATGAGFREARGLLGEAGMGFAGYPQQEGWAFLTGPSGGGGHRWNEPGFDGVAFRVSGPFELHIIDNKSLARPGNVASASAITSNVLQNLDELITTAAQPQFDQAPRIGQVRATLAQARAALAGGTPMPAEVRLVVTNFGGRSTGITAALQARGVTFRDLMAPPAAPRPAGGGSPLQARGPDAPGGLVPRPATPSTPVPPAARPGSSAAARALAREAAEAAAAEMRLLRAARIVQTGAAILEGIGALQLLGEFTGMAMSGLADRGFVLTNELAEARRLESDAVAFERDYLPFSERIGRSTLRLFAASADATAAGQADAALGEPLWQVEEWRRGVDVQIGRIAAAAREARLKRQAALAILEDPAAARAVSIATFGTAELARLLGAEEDLGRIAGALERTLAIFRRLQEALRLDLEVLQQWDRTLFETCRLGGVCTSRTVIVPFVGTSTIRFLPAGGQAPP